jgi:hypothetical protein
MIDALAMLVLPVIAAPSWTSDSAYGHWGVNMIVVALTIVVVAVCVILHYEVLSALSRRLGRLERADGGHQRRRVLYGIFGVLSVHVLEIWVFGLAFYLLQRLGPLFGQVHGIAPDSLVDHVYFSAVTFTTVGFGDVIPVGPVRFLAGTEALCGFVLITWSASFTYLEMHRFWRRD